MQCQNNISVTLFLRPLDVGTGFFGTGSEHSLVEPARGSIAFQPNKLHDLTFEM